MSRTGDIIFGTINAICFGSTIVAGAVWWKVQKQEAEKRKQKGK